MDCLKKQMPMGIYEHPHNEYSFETDFYPTGDEEGTTNYTHSAPLS